MNRKKKIIKKKAEKKEDFSCRYFELLATTVENPAWGIPEGRSFNLHIFAFDLHFSYYAPVEDKYFSSYVKIFTEIREESKDKKLSEHLASALNPSSKESTKRIAIALSGGGYYSHCACAATFSVMLEWGNQKPFLKT